MQDPTELGTLVSGVNCTACKFSYLLPRHPLDYNTVWECQVLYYYIVLILKLML